MFVFLMKKVTTDKDYNHNIRTRYFLESVAPIKVTESRCLKLHLDSWGLLSDYVLESVKINRSKSNQVSSTAVLQVADVSGQITCVVKGKTIGLLFGLTDEEWSDIEDMCDCGQQLFYRNFKNGLSINFSCAQKLFYNFCHTSLREDVLIAIFCRTTNTRTKDKHDALINIKQLRKQTGFALDIYINHLKRKSDPLVNPTGNASCCNSIKSC